jgi:hypothetical protein
VPFPDGCKQDLTPGATGRMMTRVRLGQTCWGRVLGGSQRPAGRPLRRGPHYFAALVRCDVAPYHRTESVDPV